MYSQIKNNPYLGLIEYLAETYKAGSNPEVTQIVSSMDLHILPSMNPDGFQNSTEGSCYGVTGRWNGNGVDLNRNFPSWDNLTLDDSLQLYENRYQ